MNCLSRLTISESKSKSQSPSVPEVTGIHAQIREQMSQKLGTKPQWKAAIISMFCQSKSVRGSARGGWGGRPQLARPAQDRAPLSRGWKVASLTTMALCTGEEGGLISRTPTAAGRTAMWRPLQSCRWAQQSHLGQPRARCEYAKGPGRRCLCTREGGAEAQGALWKWRSPGCAQQAAGWGWRHLHGDAWHSEAWGEHTPWLQRGGRRLMPVGAELLSSEMPTPAVFGDSGACGRFSLSTHGPSTAQAHSETLRVPIQTPE